MLNLMKIRRPFLAVAAVGVLGLSTYGAFNTVSAFDNAGQSFSIDYSNVNNFADGSIKPD